MEGGGAVWLFSLTSVEGGGAVWLFSLTSVEGGGRWMALFID